MKKKHLISRDELLAAGALWVPPSWRKSLSAPLEARNKMLFDDQELAAAAAPLTSDADLEDELAEEEEAADEDEANEEVADED